MRTIYLICWLVLLRHPVVYADTRSSTPVGPGIIFHHESRDAGPWHLYVLEIDTGNPWLKFESVKAGDRMQALERTSAMAARKDAEGHRVIGAVNADFFETSGLPVGAQIIDGSLLKRPVSRSVFAIGSDNGPMIGIFSFQGSLISPDNLTMPVNGINESRGDNALVVYNAYFGKTTLTNQWGTEITAEYISGNPVVNDTMRILVTAKDSTMTAGSGSNQIPANGLVISGHGTAGAFLSQNVLIGDTISLVLRLIPDEYRLFQLVGGTPRIIRDGLRSVEYAQEGIGSSFATDRHPRTAVGFSADSGRVYFFVVDGRQPGYSAGMSLYELADYMLEWGVYQGINLDGGGSSTMVVRGAVQNRPSDAGGERSVANAMMIVSSAPRGPLACLRVTPERVFVLTGSQIRFSAAGFDVYYNPLTIDADSLTWSCTPEIGLISDDGSFTAGSNPDSGYVYVASGGVKDSSRVYITTLSRIDLEPDPVILKVGEQQQIIPKAFDAFQNPVILDLTDYQWQVTGSIGSVSHTGLFTADSAGEGLITASYGGVTGTAAVSVGVSAEIILDDFSSTAGWTMSGVRVDLSGCGFTADAAVHFSSPASGRLNYSLTTGGTSALYLDCSIPVSGSPVSISLMVYGDGRAHWLRAEFQDADGEKFLLNFTEAAPGIDWENSWQELEIPLANAIAHWSNPSAVMTFPLIWKRIYLAETNELKKDAGTIYLDDFKANYITTGVPEQNQNIPRHFRLEQNFPNPFNPETTISYTIPRGGRVNLDIFNIHGQKVASLADDYQRPGTHQIIWRAAELASSVYFYRLSFDDRPIASRKMIVLK